MDLVKKIDKYIDEATISSYGEERGKTTKVNGHNHDYFIKRISGDGTTSSNMGHFHKIKAMVVLPANNHIHDLLGG